MQRALPTKSHIPPRRKTGTAEKLGGQGNTKGKSFTAGQHVQFTIKQSQLKNLSIAEKNSDGIVSNIEANVN